MQPTFTRESRRRFPFHRQPYCLGGYEHRVMSRIYFCVWLAVACCLFCAGCRSDGDEICPALICQLRVPKSASPNPKTTRVDVATSTREDGHFLWGYNQKVQKEDGQFLIFEPDHFLVFAEPDSRRALIIDDHLTPAQVFRVYLPSNPKVRDWSQWQRPDFLATGDVGWAFIYKQKIQGVITNIPPDSFELRYKVEMQDLGPSYEMMMKRKRDSSK